MFTGGVRAGCTAACPSGHHRVAYGLCCNLGLSDRGHSVLEYQPSHQSPGGDESIRPVVAQLFSLLRLNRISRATCTAFGALPTARSLFPTRPEQHWSFAAAIDFDQLARSSDQPICPASTRRTDYTAQHRLRLGEAAAVLIPSESNMTPFSCNSRGLPGLRTPNLIRCSSLLNDFS